MVTDTMNTGYVSMPKKKPKCRGDFCKGPNQFAPDTCNQLQYTITQCRGNVAGLLSFSLAFIHIISLAPTQHGLWEPQLWAALYVVCE